MRANVSIRKNGKMRTAIMWKTGIAQLFSEDVCAHAMQMTAKHGYGDGNVEILQKRLRIG